MEQDGSAEQAKTGGAEGAAAVQQPGEYLKAARAHLRNGNLKQAYGILQEAMGFYPENPVILSYCGWLQAVVDEKHRAGIALCRKALVAFKSSDPQTAGVVYPILYLNLGKAFLAGNKKGDAYESFSKGLSYDKGNAEIKMEMKALGTRKNPPLPFLSRSNFINMLIGKLLPNSADKKRR
jgi:tetratricopeptide (TPR) repeat protein